MPAHLRLWLDDFRHPPFGYDLWAKTYQEAIDLLDPGEHVISHCSLDHDLADEHYEHANTVDPIPRGLYKEKTGYAVLEWMRDKGIWVPSIYVHTLNEMGASEMLQFIREHAPAHVKYQRTKPRDPAPPR